MKDKFNSLEESREKSRQLSFANESILRTILLMGLVVFERLTLSIIGNDTVIPTDQGTSEWVAPSPGICWELEMLTPLY